VSVGITTSLSGFISTAGLTIDASGEVGYGSDSYYYYLEWSTNGGASYITKDQDNGTSRAAISLSFVTGALALGTTCKVRLRYRSYSSYSGWGDYETLQEITVIATAVPVAPTVDSTATGYHDLTPVLDWGDVTGAQTYDIEYGTIDGTPEVTSLPDSTYTLPTQTPGAEVSWRVRAVNGNGTGAWSSTWTVDILDVPSTPTLSLPEDSATSQAVKPTLTWADGGDESNAASSYKVYLDNSNGSTLVSTQSGLTYVPNASLNYNTVYSWTVVAVNEAGQSSPATIISFTTVAVTVGEPVSQTDFTRRLMAISGNGFYYEDDDGQMRRLYGLELDLTEKIMMCAAYNSVFIANGSDKKVVDFVSAKLDLSAIPAGADRPFNGDKLTGDAGAQMSVTHWPGGKVVYGVMLTTDSFVGTETLVLNGVAITPDVGATAETYGSPFWYYDWQEDEPAVNTNMPANSSVVFLYGGRIVLLDRNLWYMSEAGDPFNFSYAADNANSAVAGVPTEAGKIGDQLIGGFPFKDGYLVLGCVSSLWVLTGNPMAGGSQQELTRAANMFSATSFCYGDTDGNDEAYILGTNGIHRINADWSVENLSIPMIPNLVEDLQLNPNDHRVSMAYDKKRHGVEINIAVIATGETTAYWFDLRTKGFFPETIESSIAPSSLHYYDAQAEDKRDVMVGCVDGVIRRYDATQKYDETGWTFAENKKAISGEVLIGPIQISNSRNFYAILDRLSFVLAGGSSGGSQADTDSVAWDICVANTAEDVLEKAVAGDFFTSGTITGAGRARDTRPRIAGVFAAIKLSNVTVDETWALEEVLAEVSDGGRIR